MARTRWPKIINLQFTRNHTHVLEHPNLVSLAHQSNLQLTQQILSRLTHDYHFTIKNTHTTNRSQVYSAQISATQKPQHQKKVNQERTYKYLTKLNDSPNITSYLDETKQKPGYV